MVISSDYYDDVYFSAQDGLEETQYVFLKGNNLEYRWQADQFKADEFVIAETGFGTGLNFLASWNLFHRVAPKNKKLHFISVEKHPLEKAKISAALGVWRDKIGAELDEYLSAYPDHIDGDINLIFDGGSVCLTVLIGDAMCRYSDWGGGVDAWFLDGFKPSSNPDMWTQDLFNETFRLCNKNGSFSTFTAAGFVRRGLIESGFDVQKIKGFGRKREMIVGVKA